MKLKISLLDYAIKGALSAKFRRENENLNALKELEIYNATQKTRFENLTQDLKKLENEAKKEKDKNAKALLKSQMQSLKKELSKCQTITPLNSNEAPFTIPNSWTWVRLGELCEIVSGESVNLNENLPVLDVKFLRNKGEKKLANSGNLVDVKDRLILMDGENSGEVFIAKEKGFLGSTLKKLEFLELTRIEFMDFIFLHYKDMFKDNKKGAAIPHLDRNLFINLPIPLPPLKEQEFITQILDKLFTLKKGLRVD